MVKLRMTYPTYRQPGRVTYGIGSLRVLAECTDLTKTALFVSGNRAVQDRLAACLEKSGVSLGSLSVIEKPEGEPSYEMVRTGADFLADRRFRRVVGIGGGSVLDWCRLAWAESCGMLTSDGPSDAATNNDPRRPEFWLVPTTCGSGAEASHVAVYTSAGEKIPFRSEAFVADHVILDGQFLAHVDSAVLAASLCDALSHAIESYVSLIPCHLAQEAAVSALCIILEHGDREPGNCRNERLMEAGYLGGLAASHGSVGVVHAFAHALASHGVAHGQGNALGLIAGIETNSDVPALTQLVERAGLASVEALCDRIRPIVAAAVPDDRRSQIVQLLEHSTTRDELRQRISRDVCLRTNPKPLDDEAIDAFLDRAITEVQFA